MTTAAHASTKRNHGCLPLNQSIPRSTSPAARRKRPTLKLAHAPTRSIGAISWMGNAVSVAPKKTRRDVEKVSARPGMREKSTPMATAAPMTPNANFRRSVPNRCESRKRNRVPVTMKRET
ncbi:MAG: hypothetical protein A4E39_01685 [Methanoregulaceae archaeon PtaB.Bin152]|nr:MAG: hypothetical protein A4E39_01685 [Methanoregulaceae archaeon PtaB.Bin152]